MSFLALTAPLAADGTETLATPAGFDSAAGNALLVGGVGLAAAQPGLFQLDVPEGATVIQVLAYWNGLALNKNLPGPSDAIQINGLPVTGASIGGPSNFVGPYNSVAFRADVTALGLIGPGVNFISVGGLDFAYEDNGFSLVVLIDDGSGVQRSIDLRDGVDFAYGGFTAEYATTTPQVYEFAAAAMPRTARLTLVVGGASAGRPNVIEVTVDGVVSQLVDQLGAAAGPEWDVLELDIDLPAGATSATVQLLSEDSGTGPNAGGQVSSFDWIVGALEVEIAGDPAGCPPLFWVCNIWRWDPWCPSDNVTKTITLHDRFNDNFNVSPYRSGVPDSRRLYNTLTGGCTWGDWLQGLLNRETTAALANADAGINYPYTLAEVRALYRDAVGADWGPETRWSLLLKFHDANRLGCPW